MLGEWVLKYVPVDNVWVQKVSPESDVTNLIYQSGSLHSSFVLSSISLESSPCLSSRCSHVRLDKNCSSVDIRLSASVCCLWTALGIALNFYSRLLLLLSLSLSFFFFPECISFLLGWRTSLFFFGLQQVPYTQVSYVQKACSLSPFCWLSPVCS